MFKFAVALIVTSVLVTVYAVEILRKSQVPDIQWANHYLDVPERGEALPVVLILEYNRTLSNPDNISLIAVEGRKIVNGTHFFMMRGSQNQMFFCQEGNCLARRDFHDSEQLKCVPPESEATPRVTTRDPTATCGIGGSFHRVMFPICPPDPNWPYQYQYTTEGITIYDFCYHENSRKILFTTHLINSPKLLATFLLYQDRTLNYPFEYNDTYPTADYNNLYTRVLLQESFSSAVSLHPNYTVQNLVPREDMPFGIWNKTINQSYNVALQHNNILHVWNNINAIVREILIRKDRVAAVGLFLVKTAILDNRIGWPTNNLSYEIYNCWVKMVISLEKETQIPVSGVVLFLNNFTNFGYDEVSIAHEQSLRNDFGEYCGEWVVECSRDLKNEVEQAMSWVKCCLLTPRLAQLFDVGTTNTLPLLYISELTVREWRP